MSLLSRLPVMWRLLRRLSCATVLLGVAGQAAAQLGLPPLPNMPALPTQPPLAAPLPPQGGPAPLPGTLLGQGRASLDELLRRESHRLERDPAGEIIVRGELLLQSPPPALLDAAFAAGFELLRDEPFPALELRLVTLQAPLGLDTASARELLHRLAPQLEAEFNHVYLPSGTVGRDADRGLFEPAPQGRSGVASLRVGLIDAGVQARHPALRHVRLQRHGCNGRSVPQDHGTAVASLLVGNAAGVRGVLPQAALFAADIYCGDRAGGTVHRIVQALEWMAREQVPVINLSLVGPPNRLLEQAVRRLAARGHLLVAAVGNDGPSAPPLYPAAYAGAVIGVTAVDRRHRVLPEALRGPQVVFAAWGAAMRAARGERGEADVRGTSFAAPLVAGLLAAQLTRPDPEAARRAVARLTARAIDLGAPGKDPVYGHGFVNAADRVATGEPAHGAFARN